MEKTERAPLRSNASRPVSHSSSYTSASSSPSTLDPRFPSCPPLSTKIFIEHGSFLDIDWKEADVVFANSTCYDTQMMDKISRKAEKLKAGSYVITISKGFHDAPHLALLDVTQFEFSWGSAQTFLFQRKKEEKKEKEKEKEEKEKEEKKKEKEKENK